jgi:hypothetical protein
MLRLTFVESLWLEEIVAGRRGARADKSMNVDPAVSLRTLRTEYRAARTASNEIIVALGDPEAPVTRNGNQRDLRWALLAVIQESARHAEPAARPAVFATCSTPTSLVDALCKERVGGVEDSVTAPRGQGDAMSVVCSRE